jgi:hypothetical protein
LKCDVQKYIKHEKDGIFSEVGKENNTMEDLFLGWWQYFMDFLCYLPYPADYRYRLIDSLKNYYAGKDDEMKVLNEFEATYTPNKAVWWYTRETFLYRLFNRALRQKNVELVLLFGFFLQDLYTQMFQQHHALKSKYSGKSLKVYRGQIMSAVELKNLLKHCEKGRPFNVINISCFSTSLKRSVSLASIPQQVKSDESVRVLFEITIDVTRSGASSINRPFFGSTVRPFGDISSISYFPGESEILFMPGAGFKLENFNVTFYEPENVWIIQLQPVDRQWHAAQEHFVSTNTRRTLKNCITSLPFNLVFHSASLEQIDIVFDHLTLIYPLEKWILAVKEHCLALKLRERKDDQTPMQRIEKESLGVSKLEKALNIWSTYTSDADLNSFVVIGDLHKTLTGFRTQTSRLVNKKKHCDLAISNYQLAMARVATDHESIYVLQQLTTVYHTLMLSKGKDEIKQYGSYYRHYMELTLKKMVKVYPKNDMRTADLFQELAVHCHLHFDDPDAALVNYKEALVIILQNPSESPYLSYSNLSNIYFRQKKNYPEALRLQLLNHEDMLNRFAIKPTDNDDTIWRHRDTIARSHIALADCYAPLDQRQSLRHLQMAKNLYQKIKDPSRAAEIEKVEKKIEALQM